VPLLDGFPLSEDLDAYFMEKRTTLIALERQLHDLLKIVNTTKELLTRILSLTRKTKRRP
jgi:hypothetical protein